MWLLFVIVWLPTGGEWTGVELHPTYASCHSAAKQANTQARVVSAECVAEGGV
jgi:hypothetical protein